MQARLRGINDEKEAHDTLMGFASLNDHKSYDMASSGLLYGIFHRFSELPKGLLF